MAEPKTRATTASVTKFLNQIEDPSRRRDCKTLVEMMQTATKAKPVMWGPAIIGFGDRDYFGASGKPTKWFEVGFSPRKAALSLYLMGGKDKALIAKLGKSSTSGTSMSAGCLYIKSLRDVDETVLRKLITTSVKGLRKSPKGKQA
jgi:uncharacterized protein DUF1801